MSLSIGIVGLPNVGKSTLFNALLKQNLALSANYPFATIEPNVGIATVPDERLAVLAEIVQTTIMKPATIEFIDIAGLVAGAHQGEGLGNQFLSHIRETSAIAHVLRAFSDEEIIREGSSEPQSDLITIRTELQLADLATLQKQKEPKGIAETKVKQSWQQILAMSNFLQEGRGINDYFAGLAVEEERLLAQTIAQELNLLTAKKEIFIINVDEGDLRQPEELKKKYAQILSVEQKQIVIVSAKIEAELASLDSSEQKQFLSELGVQASGLDRLAQVAYQTLNLQSFLTAGSLEVKAWTIAQKTTAKEAAGVIHSDFSQKFIKAKVVSYQDFVQFKGWKGASEAGKIRIEGKDYLMQKDDIVEFMISN